MGITVWEYKSTGFLYILHGRINCERFYTAEITRLHIYHIMNVKWHMLKMYIQIFVEILVRRL